MNIISPSILAADFFNLSKDIERVSNAQWLHIDVMDGHFVPNISVGIPVISSIRRSVDKFLDVHLMISEPIRYVRDFADAGADLICFHIEACSDVEATISEIKKYGKRVGVALKPGTPSDEVIKYLNRVDMVLIMTVEPGFGGQAFIEEMLPKIDHIRNALDENRLIVDIQVDGGINFHTAEQCVLAGANVLVAGSFVFSSDNPHEVVEKLKNVIV